MTDAYKTGIEVSKTLRDGVCLWAAVSEATIYTEHLEGGYPNWHPAPDSFQGVVRLFIYREITGDSYRTLETYQEPASHFRNKPLPMESEIRYGEDYHETANNHVVGPTGNRDRKLEYSAGTEQYCEEEFRGEEPDERTSHSIQLTGEEGVSDQTPAHNYRYYRRRTGRIAY
ncbi:hypothetical protein NDI85_18385 [Halomicroarcula sp. S1AR25-4]|uniref:hypothetical protein n=1 Tax=Haloarcula sp. S1AR25-4 TaxID=2950538 RepID=UPI002876923F|nr:hypothetical protein [Halomicroarcula sp. S1AR25-4]MDS0279763.1 hypothetical protein [Halomicroarcula sp. S1AR25-4]